LELRASLKKSRLIVVKIGASSLSTEQGSLDLGKIAALCDELVALRKRGINVILVSSGAIRAGKAIMREQLKNGEIKNLQAFAAVGQVMLMESYRDTMAERGYNVAQILLTWDDFRNKTRTKHLINTFETLLSLGVIPIINENDTIAIDEIKFGDNDTLSALVAVNLKADLLILLSDIDGLYTGDPSYPSSKLIPFVEEVSADIERLASKRHGGFGGMDTKLSAGKLATANRIPMVIANGKANMALERIVDGERIGTIFMPRGQNVKIE